jgi:cell division protein FtsB
MRYFQERRQLKRIIYSKASLILLLVLLLLLSRAVFGVYRKYQLSDRGVQASAAELAELEVRAEKLSLDIDKLETAQGLESEIRARFPVAKVGERVIVLVDRPISSTTVSSTTDGVWNWFRKIFR